MKKAVTLMILILIVIVSITTSKAQDYLGASKDIIYERFEGAQIIEYSHLIPSRILVYFEKDGQANGVFLLNAEGKICALSYFDEKIFIRGTIRKMVGDPSYQMEGDRIIYDRDVPTFAIETTTDPLQPEYQYLMIYDSDLMDDQIKRYMIDNWNAEHLADMVEKGIVSLKEEVL